MSKTKLESFINQFVALLQGDDNKVLAEKNWRSANSAISMHINNLEGQTIDLEDKRDHAKENYKNASVNFGKKIEDRTQYVQNLLNARHEINEAEENLKFHLENIDLLKEMLQELTPVK
jgi:predicted RNase H-like nuclease (RuvC/YqgF family)